MQSSIKRNEQKEREKIPSENTRIQDEEIDLLCVLIAFSKASGWTRPTELDLTILFLFNTCVHTTVEGMMVLNLVSRFSQAFITVTVEVLKGSGNRIKAVQS